MSVLSLSLIHIYHIKLLEKKYEINGEKAYYLSENFLVCRTSIPPKKKLNILTRVINNISNKYDGADLKTKMDTKSALQKEYVDNKSFDIEEIGLSLIHISIFCFASFIN